MRESQTKKVPVTLILGDNERDNNTISYRLFGTRETTTLSVNEFINHINKIINDKSLNI